MGERGIMEELASVGISSSGGPDDNGKAASFCHEMQHDPAVGAVVCGVDPGLTYYKVGGSWWAVRDRWVSGVSVSGMLAYHQPAVCCC